MIWPMAYADAGQSNQAAYGVSGSAAEYYDYLPQKQCYAKSEESQGERSPMEYIAPPRCKRVAC